MEKATDELELQHLAGGDITKFPPLFSPDANCVFVVIDKGVQVFSATTGQPIRVLEGPDEPLISLEFDILDPRVLIACTKSGEVIRWKWSTGTIASRVNLTIKGVARFETFNLIDYFTNESSPCAFVTSVKQGNPLQWSLVDTVTGKVVHCVLSLRLGRQPVQVAVSKGHFKYFVVIQGAVLFYVDYESWTWLKLTNSEKVPFTCVNVNPKEHMVATGDEKGKISLWRQFFGTDAKVKVTLLHWHHTRVTSIAFSISGSILYSSGLESVLVKWNISRPEERFFVPRMSSVILHISASKENSNLAVCTADNGIQILDVDLKTKCTLQEFTYIYNDKTGNYAFPVGLRVNPRQNTLVLNGRTGHLQFYSPHTKSLLYNMDIVCQNQTSLESDKILYSICVSRAAFNIDWMATGEIFDDKQHIPELRLKFWEYQKEIQSYVLNTNVEIPHERGFVAIEFSSPFNIDNLLCATAGLDNIVKVWSLENSNNIYNEGKVWYCISQINYKNYPIKSVGFSQDGSLLAAGFGNTLCIYKTDNFKLLAALLPNGGFDSSLSKVQIRIPKINKNGFKSNSNSKKQETIRSFVNLLQKSDESIIRNIQSSMKSKKLKELFSVEESTKKQLYKDIKSMSQLDLLQKLLIYQNLGLSFQLNEEWHTKMYEYIHSNILNNSKRKKFEKEVCCLSTQSRFKAKYRLNKFYRRKLGDDKRVNTDLQTLTAILKLKKSTNRHLTNGICENNQQQGSNRNPIPPLQSMTSIKNISFCYGDFAHLVVACTENRVLIWNLLTLRLQTVLKLTTEHIAIDAQTNLISVFTKNQELYVFLPGVALPVYFKSDMPRVNGMTWLPKKHPKSQAVIVNWQSRSTLYFLTDNNEIVYLGSKDDLEHTLPTYPNNTNVYAQQYSTFGALPANQFNNTEAQISSDQKISIGVHGKDAVKSFLEMSCHTMPPLRLLCNDFLKCVSQLNTNDKKESKKPSEVNEENHNNDSTDEDEKIPLYNNPTEKLSESNIKKTKSKQNELSEEYLEKILAETIDVEF